MKKNKKIIIFDQPHDLSVYLLKHWVKAAQKSIQEQGRFCVVLQGSDDLREFYAKISGIQDYSFWENVYIFLADQYHVGRSHPEHQFQYLKNNLLDYINIPARNIFSIVTHTENSAYSADQYEEDLTQFFRLSINDIPKFDYAVVGLSQIEHLKSIFQEREVISPMVQHQKIQNLTLININPQILGSAEHIILVGSGEKASENARKMIEIYGQNCLAVKNDAGLHKSLVFLLDSVAAHKLSQEYDHFNSEEGVVLFEKTR